MSYNYEKLEQRITEVCGSLRVFARRIGRRVDTIRTKLINGASFTTEEIEKAVEVLAIKPREIDEYFFRRYMG